MWPQPSEPAASRAQTVTWASCAWSTLRRVSKSPLGWPESFPSANGLSAARKELQEQGCEIEVARRCAGCRVAGTRAPFGFEVAASHSRSGEPLVAPRTRSGWCKASARDHFGRRADCHLFLPVSKSDTGGHGVDGGDRTCPAHVLKLQVTRPVGSSCRRWVRGRRRCSLLRTTRCRPRAAAGAGQRSARRKLCRSAVKRCAWKRWHVTVVQHLGSWASSQVLEYVEEAYGERAQSIATRGVIPAVELGLGHHSRHVRTVSRPSKKRRGIQRRSCLNTPLALCQLLQRQLGRPGLARGGLVCVRETPRSIGGGACVAREGGWRRVT